MKRFPLALASFLVSVAAWAQGESAPDTGNPVLVPGGFVDAATNVVYVNDTEHGIVALGAQDGSIRWESAEASKPLAVVAGRLMVLKGGSGSFRIAALDVETGRLVRESDAVTLDSPAGVAGPDHDGESSYFLSRAWVCEGALFVRWNAGLKPPVGGTVQQGMLELCQRACTGIVKVDPETCALQKLPDAGKRLSRSFEGGTRLDDLPETVRDIARRQRWEFGVVVGNRVYGRVPEPRTEADSVQVHAVEAVDLATGKQVWRRKYESRPIESPPSIPRP